MSPSCVAQRIHRSGKKLFRKYGYNGLFEDDTWYRIESWGIDVFPPVRYDEYTWRRNLFAFLDSIKANIARVRRTSTACMRTYRTACSCTPTGDDGRFCLHVMVGFT